MLNENETLKVGQYLIGADKKLYKITSIHKKSYGVEALHTSGYHLNVLKNGRLNMQSYRLNSPVEFFICNKPEEVINKYIDKVVSDIKATKVVKYNEELVAKAKYFLEQVTNIDSISVDEVDDYDYYGDYDNDYDDYPDYEYEQMHDYVQENFETDFYAEDDEDKL